MKLLKLLLLSLFVSLSVNADVAIKWNSFEEVKDTDGTSAAPSSYFAQLIWSDQNTVFSSFDDSDPLSVDSGFEVIYSQTLGFDGYIIGESNPLVFSGNGYVDGYVYSRVFSASTPELNDYWGESSNFSQQIVEYDTLNPTTTSVPHNPVNIVVDNLIIPEPTTIAILLMGIAGIFGFRKHLRK